jgi:AcrR family transcriptional regulator
MSPLVSERADAARNRAAILEAAARLFSASSPPPTVDAIAAAAGVGKGTVFRRFGDYTGLVEALIAPHVAALREEVTAGRPPLGPGAPPAASLRAYLDALLEFVWANHALIRALEHRRPHAYYANPASQFWIAELRRRLAAARPDIDAAYLALAVFTNLRADVLSYLHDEQGFPPPRIRAGLQALAAGQP